MPCAGTVEDPNYYRYLYRQRAEYRKKLIAKGVMNGSLKMMKLMHRKRF